MKSIVWTAPAQRDLDAIEAYWIEHSSGRAVEIVERFDRAAIFLAGTPEGGSPMERDGVRKWSVARTRCVLIYQVDGDELLILRVRHGSTNWRAES